MKTTFNETKQLSLASPGLFVHFDYTPTRSLDKSISVVAKGKKKIRFIDLFAGIGGFHIALESFGGTCVFASEIDNNAAIVYEKNLGLRPAGDITKIKAEEIPPFDVLCAGFPCQPFSKGGFRQGFEDTRGTLFFDICRIIECHRPRVILLENVPNLVSHDEGRTYQTILRHLKELGYFVPDSPIILSPHNFGVPVLRPRMYIPAIRSDVVLENGGNPDWDVLRNASKSHSDIYSVMNLAPEHEAKASEYAISEYETRILDMWDEFYRGVDIKVIGFPVWSEEFGQNYDYSNLPDWKKNFIMKNRELYIRNRIFLDKWLEKHGKLEWCVPTHRKLEWQAGSDYPSIYDCIIQFRPSGVRVKRPDKFSTLVAMNHPQIVGKYRRRLTPDESKRLQSFPDSYELHPSDGVALKQIGNSVNITVLKAIFSKLETYF